MITTIKTEREIMCYGAYDLKGYIRKATTKGLMVTLTILLGCGGVYATLIVNRSIHVKHQSVTARTKIINLPPPSIIQQFIPPSELHTGQIVRAGVPVPAPDIMFSLDNKDFAAIDKISWATPLGADGEEQGFLALTRDIDAEVRDEEKPPYEFDAVEKEPYVDLKELQQKVIYPELALRSGISGKVILRVLIGKNGAPKKYLVESSESSLLNEAAIKAVMSSVATPAIHLNQPVDHWISIPIVFRLR